MPATTHEIDVALEKVTDEEIDFTVEALSGDLGDALLDRYRNTQKPWAQHTQDEQRDIVCDFREVAENYIRKACRIIAGYDRRVITVKVANVGVKGGVIKATCICAKTQQTLVDLGMAEGDYVLIVVPNEEHFIGTKTKAEDLTTPNQHSFFNYSDDEDGLSTDDREDD
jgi:hypothetical protein